MTMPASDIENWARSRSASIPICCPAGMTTFLSITQRCNRAPGPIRTPGKMIESVTSADVSMYTSGPMIDRSTTPPETIDPAHNRLFEILPCSPLRPYPTFAGGNGSCRL